MSVVGGLGTATGAKGLRGRRPAGQRAFPRTKRASVVVEAVALLALAAFGALIPPPKPKLPTRSTTTTRREVLRPSSRGRRFPSRQRLG